ncbi:MAG TPA: VWA domain-containing protein [Planctomycetaceae bacterium]|nr:VWA domain-containing protein [Planctomycetaceae bacterium]
MTLRNQIPAILASLALHAALLAALGWIVLERQLASDVFALDTIVDDEDRRVDEVVQELDEQEAIAETFNLVAGSVSTKVGGSEAPLVQQQPIETDDLLREPDLKVTPGTETLPGQTELAVDLGEAEITGEVGAVVEGYGPALDRLTWELIRLMRSDKLLVVWLFDESGSMKDDQEDVKKRLYRVYEELKIVERDPRATGGRPPRRLNEILLTAIHSFGETIHQQTRAPTSDYAELMSAIDQIPVDPSGVENMCQSLLAVLRKYKGQAVQERRKLVVIVVSDESGDDGEGVEQVIQEARTSRAPIYILGRESVFGSLYAHVRWTQPETSRVFYLPIRRGPETPFAEQLQFDGYRARRDSQMSGFGPYEQVRICRDTGGIFFQLPHEEQDLNDFEARKDEMLTLREYLPDIDSRREYAARRDQSEFRKAIWDVIATLNPYQPGNEWLNLPDPEFEREVFTTEPGEYMPRVLARIRQMDRILGAMKLAEQHLERVRPLRARERSLRWRANYDLITAQLPWYRVRMFEYAIALHQFALQGVPAALAKNSEHNRWYIRESPSEWVLPDAEQQKLLQVTAEDLQQAHESARGRLEDVKRQHPGSPWAQRAEWELGRKFGVTFGTYYQAPPRPDAPPPPRPTPPPRL